MILNVFIDEQTVPVDVPESLLQEASDFFARMDADMDRGWQMSRVWVERPDVEQRCQIAADRLLTAIEKENQPMIGMMAAYILARMPDVSGVRVSTNGEIQETELIRRPHPVG